MMYMVFVLSPTMKLILMLNEEHSIKTIIDLAKCETKICIISMTFLNLQLSNTPKN